MIVAVSDFRVVVKFWLHYTNKFIFISSFVYAKNNTQFELCFMHLPHCTSSRESIAIYWLLCFFVFSPALCIMDSTCFTSVYCSVFDFLVHWCVSMFYLLPCNPIQHEQKFDEYCIIFFSSNLSFLITGII